MMYEKKEIIGTKVNHLTVIGIAERRNGQKYYKCKCDCGGTAIVASQNLRGKRAQKGCSLCHGYCGVKSPILPDEDIANFALEVVNTDTTQTPPVKKEESFDRKWHIVKAVCVRAGIPIVKEFCQWAVRAGVYQPGCDIKELYDNYFVMKAKDEDDIDDNNNKEQ